MYQDPQHGIEMCLDIFSGWRGETEVKIIYVPESHTLQKKNKGMTSFMIYCEKNLFAMARYMKETLRRPPTISSNPCHPP